MTSHKRKTVSDASLWQHRIEKPMLVHSEERQSDLAGAQHKAGIANANTNPREQNNKPDQLDQLLRAIAKKDQTFQNDAVDNTGDIAVTLDSIMRWIGKAEKRFTEVKKNSSENKQKFHQIMMLISLLTEAWSKQIIHMKQQDSVSLKEIAHQEEEATASQPLAGPHSGSVDDRLTRLETLITSAERELEKLETRLVNSRSHSLRENVTPLRAISAEASQKQSRNRTSSKQFFDIVKQQIEEFATDIATVRLQHTEQPHTHQEGSDQPVILDETELQKSKPAAEKSMLQRDDSTQANRTSSTTRDNAENDLFLDVKKLVAEDIVSLKQRLSQIETIIRQHHEAGPQTSPLLNTKEEHAREKEGKIPTNSFNAPILGSFIEAARQATRQEQAFFGLNKKENTQRQVFGKRIVL